MFSRVGGRYWSEGYALRSLSVPSFSASVAASEPGLACDRN
jgi:hypothetical protein